MRKETVTVKITCDGCGSDIDNISHPTLFDKHYCATCCRKLEEYYRKVVHGEVPDRRGGYRQLGAYDG